MTDLANVTSIAIGAQSAPESYVTLTGSDLWPCANLSWRPNALTTDNPEYTGTIHRPGPIVLGASYDVTFDLLIRGPGGSAPPSGGDFIPGRVLRSLGFTENVVATAIPVAAEAGTSGTTSSLTLGTGAAGTAELYKGLAILLAGIGTAPKGLTMISDYSAAKVAKFAETFGSAITGNYQIPTQLAYTLSSTGTPPLLTLGVGQGNRQYTFGDMAPSSAVLTFPTSSRDGGQDYSRLSLTYTGDLVNDTSGATSVVSPAVAVPPFKGGKLHIAGLAMGGSSLSIDLGLRSAFPPNPNKASGSDPAQLVETRRTLNMTLNQVAKSYLDLLDLAKQQGVHPIQALYGLASGNYIGFVATAARFNFPETQSGGDFFTTQGEAYVDGAEKTVGLVFPYWS